MSGRVLSLLVMLLGATASLQVPHHLYAPIRENCTQVHRLEQLLDVVRESATTQREAVEAQRETSSTLINLLKEIKEATVSRRPTKTKCEAPFVLVAGSCLLLDLKQNITWMAARQFCADKGGDLATFPDANTFAAYLAYINVATSFDPDDSEQDPDDSEQEHLDIWIGGTDKGAEGVWRWVTGELMPRGSPFWGMNTNKMKFEPSGGTEQNCALLYNTDQYYVHDGDCEWRRPPLCQKH